MSDTKLALYLSAEKYRMGKLYKKAVKKYQAMEELDPNDLGILKKLALCYGKLGNSDEEASTYLRMARIQKRNDKPELCKALIEKTLALKSDFPDAVKMLKELEETIAIEKSETISDKIEIQEIETPPVKLETPLFKNLNDDQLESIIKVISTLKITKGMDVFKEGDSSYSLYIIKEGKFDVKTSITSETKIVKQNILSQLTKGFFFGEFAFLTGTPRVATVTASEDSVIYELTKENLEKLIKTNPEIEDRLFLFYKSRALDLVLAKSPLFNSVPAKERQVMLEEFVLKKYKKGEIIIKEGQKSGSLFLIKNGEVSVETTSPKGKQVFLNKIGKHQFFGEISFLTDLPRTATVTAFTDCELLLIGKEDLLRIVEKFPNIRKVLTNFQQHRAMSTVEKLSSS